MKTGTEIKGLGPREWLETMVRFREDPRLWAAFEPLLDRWYDIAEFKYDEAREFDEVWAQDEFDLDVHIGQVRYRDLWWLRKTFEADDLAALALRLAPLFRAGREWEIVENETHAVVVDRDRGLVIDLLHGDRLSPAASLALAGEIRETWAGEEAVRFAEERLAAEHARLAELQRHLSPGGEILH